MIAVIDYGRGNLLSVRKAFEHLGFDAKITSDSRQILDASHVVLPGVGAFADCMNGLESKGLIPVVEKVIRSGRPFLGICVGLQLLFTGSNEFGDSKGLGVIKGSVKNFSDDMSSAGGDRLKIPHMGWNNIKIHRKMPVFDNVEDGSYFYFVHSYFVKPDDESFVLATTDYGIEFVSAISIDNITGCQFHPEKSQKNGLTILKNFGEQK